jgi:hypothetical protein
MRKFENFTIIEIFEVMETLIYSDNNDFIKQIKDCIDELLVRGIKESSITDIIKHIID